MLLKKFIIERWKELKKNQKYVDKKIVNVIINYRFIKYDMKKRKIQF